VLDAYIIDEIKKREEERRRKEEAARPRLRIEVPQAPPTKDREDVNPEEDDGEEKDEEPGVVRIDLLDYAASGR
jgi:hypothetical protein